MAIIYRFGPSRHDARWRWISWGSTGAIIVWIAASLLFAWYAENFGSYNATYGSLGAIIGFMTWIWISAIVLLLGAEINAEMERQTVQDTTVGGDKPLGHRGAWVADTKGKAQNKLASPQLRNFFAVSRNDSTIAGLFRNMPIAANTL